MKEKDLDYFVGLNYAVLMKKTSDGYCAFIPELSLFAEGESTSDAYEKLERDKLEYFKRALMVDAGSTVREPLATTVRRRFVDDLLLFGAKALVVGVIFGIIMLILVPSIDVFLDRRINQMTYLVDSLAGMGIVGRIDDKLSHMSEAQLEELRSKLRRTVLRIKPLTDELKILFQDDNRMEEKSLSPKRRARNSPSKSGE